MTKFDKVARTKRGPQSAVGTVESPTLTHEGGPALERDAKSDLFLLAVTNMVSENTFYEAAGDRDARFRSLVHQVTHEDPHWMRQFIPWLRNTANMRSAPIVAAAEYANAGGPQPRSLIDSAMSRADEPAEFMAYWTARYGNPSGGVQRGIADAAVRLYNERSALRYDGQSRAWRMGDVIEIARPRPETSWQSNLFRWLIDRRHKRDDAQDPEKLRGLDLPMLATRAYLEDVPNDKRRDMLSLDGFENMLQQAGMSWEALSGWLGGPMDKAAWEMIIPNMGYMALLRNLRNFDDAGVSDKVANFVAAKLADPDEVAKSRQFPFRFLSAYREAPSLRWAWPLEQALSHSVKNIPAMPGSTLVLVDTSASMTAGVSARSKITHADVGAVFGCSLAARGDNVGLVGFADGAFYHPTGHPQGMLKAIASFTDRIGEVGHGTQAFDALRATYQGHDRVVIISDMQTFPDLYGRSGMFGWRQRAAGQTIDQLLPHTVPLYGVNTSGYASSAIDTSKTRRHEIGGFNDALFRTISLIEAGENADWDVIFGPNALH